MSNILAEVFAAIQM